MENASTLASVCMAAVALLLSTAVVFSVSDNLEAGDHVPGQYIVVFKDSVADPDLAEYELLTRARGERINSYRSAVSGFAARFPEAEKNILERDPRVAFVSEDRVVSIADQDMRSRAVREARDERDNTGDSEIGVSVVKKSTQTIPTGARRIGAIGKANTGTGVNVAIIDTGIYYTHSDLAGKLVGGKNCTGASGGYLDQNGHGTHVAGTIAAVNDTKGVVGVAPSVKLWSVRVLDRSGYGTWSSVICGIDYVTSKAPKNGGPITIANLSLGGNGASDNNCGNSNNDALHKAICRARDAGVTIIAAAGNSAADATQFVPAAYDDAVITVSALVDSDGLPDGNGSATQYGFDDTFASFSNFGSPVDIGAPGVNIYSTWLRGSYATLSGTSMAAPHVSGAAALYIATHPGANWTTIRSALIGAGEGIGAGHSDPSGLHPEPVLSTLTL